ncbi:glycosyltransferase [Geodermatophilus amargosae]|uniref:glycosyltransferase n=1 Tax=Geodermatophilus amargosae TaxID=1296565 RepID=UPI0034DEBA6E
MPLDNASAPVRVTAVVLAYRDQPFLEDCVKRILASRDVVVDLVLVDNGCTYPDLTPMTTLPGVQVLRPGTNTGFTGGCNLAARHATGDVLVFVNSDALVEPDALAELAAAVADEEVGLACASLRLEQEPDLLNSAGNPVHVLGLSWAGYFREPAACHTEDRDVASASGAALAVRREVWNALGGFTEEFFAYCEDTDLSLRAWQRGWRVRYAPRAVVAHHYEANRNTAKFHLLERNRLAMLYTLYERRTLRLLLPPLLALEVAMLVVATAGGWLPAKLRGYRWLWANRTWLRERRAEVQAVRTVPDRAVAPLLTARFDASVIDLPKGAGLLNAVMERYWNWVRERI